MALTPTFAFPLETSVDGRFLVDANGQPFPILGRTAWSIISLTASDYRAFIDDSVAKGYNAIEVAIPHHWPGSNQRPFANNGTLLPFTKRLDGGTYTGTVSGYGNINNEAADFTQLNESYWAFADSFLDYAESKGVLVFLFLCYNGAGGIEGGDGWMQEMVANGTTKMRTYGQTIGARWANRGNIVWMLAGDYGGGDRTYTGPEAAAMDAFITGLTGVTKRSNFYSTELNGDSTSESSSTALLTATTNLNGAYTWNGHPASVGRTAYRENAGPAFLLEEPYDEEGPDGNNFNPSATQPVRRFQWWGWLSTIGGYISGNGYVWPFASGYASHLNTVGTQDMARLNAFIRSIEWWRLVPSGLGGMGTLVTAGGGTMDSTNYVAAAATAAGDLLVAYIGTGHSGNVTIDMTKMSGSVNARWYDPTNGNYTAIGTYANTGTRAFTPPGNNDAGAADWILRLDALLAVDTTAPGLSNAQPSGVLAVGTTQTTLSLVSNESATCRYATTAGTAYGVMPNTFSTTGGTAHSTLVGGLVSGQNYSYYVRCQDTAGNANTADLLVNFSLAAPDTTAPTVSVSSPAAGVTVTGIVSVSANASDNVGVAGVQFLLDGANLGAEVTTAPYTVNWNTTAAANGAHSISARARDAAGNQTASTVVAVTVSNAAPSGLVAAYGFAEGVGTTSADVTGNGHLATLQNGAAWAAGRYGSALSFDGINDQVALRNPASIGTGTADFSFMAWVKRSALGGQQRHIFSKCSPSVWQTGCKEFYFSPANVLTLGDFRSGDTNSVTIADTNWHHVALVFTRAANTVQFYVDGALRTTATKDLEADDLTHIMIIGNHLNHNAFSGLIDEVRIYSRALTATQIIIEMNAPVPTVPQ